MAVQISDDLQQKFGKLQGTTGDGCKTPAKDNVNSMMKADGSNKMADIAKSIGMDEKCQKQSRTFSDQSMMDTDTTVKADAFFVSASAANSTTVTNNVNEDAMMESGCGSFAVAASTILNETANLSCTLNSTLTGATTVVKSGAKITIKTIRPSIATIKDNNATIAKLNKDLTMVSTTYPPIHLYDDKAMAKNALIAHQNVQKTQADVLQKFIAMNPSSADLRNTNIDVKLDNTVKLKAKQQISANHKAKMAASIKSIAAAAAEQKMSQDLGFRAGSANSKQIVQQKVDNIFKSQQKSIEEKITNSFTKAESENEILIQVEGAIDGADLKIDMMVQTNVQTSQAVKSGISIGHRVAAEIGAKILTKTDTSTESAGFDDLVKEANEGLAKQMKAKGESDAASIGAMGKLSGGMGGRMLIMLLPLIIILGVLFFAPKLVSGFIPPQFKIPLMIGVGVFILFIIFGSYFSSTSEKRTWPVSTEFMSVSGDRADTLGYMITNTKGRINKKPYEDFNFTAGGTWQM